MNVIISLKGCDTYQNPPDATLTTRLNNATSNPTVAVWDSFELDEELLIIIVTVSCNVWMQITEKQLKFKCRFPNHSAARFHHYDMRFSSCVWVYVDGMSISNYLHFTIFKANMPSHSIGFCRAFCSYIVGLLLPALIFTMYSFSVEILHNQKSQNWLHLYFAQ